MTRPHGEKIPHYWDCQCENAIIFLSHFSISKKIYQSTPVESEEKNFEQMIFFKKSEVMKNKKTTDLPDSDADKKHLQSETFEINLPDVSDIPGQEKIKVPPLGELADTTISSADEEGAGILDDPQEQELNLNQQDANVTKEERKILDDAANKMQTADQQALEQATLDQEDDEGEPLSEKTALSGGDLDVPGSELDDNNEEIGEEDEENNSFSLDDETEDESNSRQ